MAAELLRVANDDNGPSRQTEEFDIDDLCARLEVAKREREEKEAARELRRQVRESVKHDDGGGEIQPVRTKRRPRPTPLVDVSNDWSRVQIPGLSPLQEDVSKSDQFNHMSVPSTAVQSPVGPASPSQLSPSKTRMPFFKSLSSDQTEARKLITGARPDDVAKRRSQTSPLLQTRFRKDSTTDQKQQSPTTHEHSMSFINEYCVSFDTTDSYPHIDMVESPQSLKPLAYPVERNIMSLPSMLRKDKKEKVRAWVDEVAVRQTEEGSVPIIAARSRPHTRSNTMPEGLIAEAAQRLDTSERGKKRRSFGAFLQTMLLPGHSANIASNHCMAI